MVVCETRKGKLIVGGHVRPNLQMVGQEPLLPDVWVYMMEEETLFYEWECGDSQ